MSSAPSSIDGISASAPGLGQRLRKRPGRQVASIRVPAPTQRLLLGLTGIVIVVCAWQLSAEFHWLNTLLTSSPANVVSTGIRLARNGTLGHAVASSAALFGISFAISAVVGVVIGAVIGWYQFFGAAVDPLVSIMYATPRIALIPLITVWFGIGFEARVLIVFLLAVFPIIINVAAGVTMVDRDHIRLARSFLATKRDILRTVALPGSVPSVISGLRQGLLMALIGVVVAEYFVGDTGVGGMIFNAGLTLNTATVYVGAILFALAAIVMTSLLRAVERRFDKWRA